MIDKRALDILNELNFAPEAVNQLIEAEAQLSKVPAWQDVLAISFLDRTIPAADVKKRHEALAKVSGVDECRAELLHLIMYLPALEAAYEARKLPRELFLEAARDLKFKNDESMTLGFGAGTRSFEWHFAFYRFDRWALGRLQYEARVYPNEDVEIGGVKVTHGDKILGMHIPSGSPLTREACMESVRKAFAFYGCTKDKPLIVHCASWLISPDHRVMLPETSNIIGFMDMFYPTGADEYDNFGNAWRVFGRPALEKPVEEWPTDTRLRKEYAAWLLAGKKVHNGYGLIVFDGETLLSAQ